MLTTIVEALAPRSRLLELFTGTTQSFALTSRMLPPQERHQLPAIESYDYRNSEKGSRKNCSRARKDKLSITIKGTNQNFSNEEV
jgi:hypothetical protein